MRNASTIPDAFWFKDYGFVCEERWRDVDFPDSVTLTRTGVEESLASSKKLPSLDGAPVASWLLARLAFLSGRRFPFSDGEVIGSDGADYLIRYYCIISPMKPAGTLYCSGSADGISFSLAYPKDRNGEEMIDAFMAILLEKPSEVASCRIVVQYAEMTDPEVAFHIPRVYGWDGKCYLNEQAPEHAVNPEDYE